MSKFNLKILSVGTLVVLSLTLNPSAFADLAAMKARLPKVVELKSKGIIGEKPDGLLGLVKDDAAAKKLVEEENKDRLAEYAKRAKEQGHPLETFQKVFGAKKLEIEPEGRMVQDESGKWIKK